MALTEDERLAGSRSAPDDEHDRSVDQLDDEDQREELRQRYYGLLQELRVVLPGVQVLLAFLLTAPFANRFVELDDVGRDLYGVALMTAALSVVVLLTPTALHRFGDRRQRRRRLQLAVASTRLGLGLLAVSIVSAVTVITRFVFGSTAGRWAGGVVAAVVVIAWLALPFALRADRSEEAGDGDDARSRPRPSAPGQPDPT